MIYTAACEENLEMTLRSFLAKKKNIAGISNSQQTSLEVLAIQGVIKYGELLGFGQIDLEILIFMNLSP